MLRLCVKILLTLVSIVLLGCLALQAPFVKKQLKERIEAEAAHRGIALQIRTIGGMLPFEWILRDVTYTLIKEGEPISFHASTIKGKISLLSLVKKKIKISPIKAQITVTFPSKDPFSKEKPSSYAIKLKAFAIAEVSLEEAVEITIPTLLIEGEGLYLRLGARFNPPLKEKAIPLEIKEGNGSFQVTYLNRFSPLFASSLEKESSLTGSFFLTKEKSHIECFSEGISLWGSSLANSTLLVDASKEPTADLWKGKASFSGGFSELPTEAELFFECDVAKKQLYCPSLKLKSAEELRLFGEMSTSFDLSSLKGHLFAQCTDLRSLRPLFPSSYLAGNVGMQIEIEKENTKNCLAKCHVEIDRLSLHSFSAKEISCEVNIHDLFATPQLEISLEGKKLCMGDFSLTKGLLHGNINGPASSFHLWLEGNYKDPFELYFVGNSQKIKNHISMVAKEFRGFALKKSFSLTKPCTVELKKDMFAMSDLFLNVGQGTLKGEVHLSPTASSFEIEGTAFPLEILRPLVKTVFLEGNASFKGSLFSSSEAPLQGHLTASLEKGLIYPEGSNDPLFSPLVTKGFFQLHLNKDLGQMQLSLAAQEGQTVQCIGSFPFTYQPFPFVFALDQHRPFSLEWMAEGKLEELFRFVNPGVHELQGWLSSRGFLFHTLADPKITADLEIQEGTYENQMTGTYLQQLKLEGNIDSYEKAIKITRFSGKDRSEGTLEGSGIVYLNLKEGFPFELNTSLSHFTTISCPIGVGKFSGPLTLLGNASFTKAQGTLKTEQVTLHIPEQLPTIFPELAIRFIHPPKSAKKKKKNDMVASPLMLDLAIEAPGHVFIEEKGLSCELAGSIHLSGTYNDVIPSGKLHLVQGKYVLGGKAFTFTEGELIFTQKPQNSAYISLSGTCDLAGITVFVSLRGPLTNPKLTFQSSPSLPTGDILSLILFNKDVSEISVAQAIELGQTLLSFSGVSAPDLLEKIRKAIGVDRLSLISSESNPSQLSVQIGKYLMKGVLLTYSQGASDRNIGVEIELAKGFTIQAENTLRRKQKFSLTWRHHY